MLIQLCLFYSFQPSTVNDPVLMHQKSEWGSTRKEASSYSSLNRMLAGPSILLFLALLTQVLPAQCRPASNDEGRIHCSQSLLYYSLFVK